MEPVSEPLRLPVGGPVGLRGRGRGLRGGLHPRVRHSPSATRPRATSRGRGAAHLHVQDRPGVAHLPGIAHREGVVAALQLELLEGELDDLRQRRRERLSVTGTSHDLKRRQHPGAVLTLLLTAAEFPRTSSGF